MTIEFDFDKNDWIEYNIWIVKSRKSDYIIKLIFSIVFFVCGLGLILLSFIVKDYGFLCLGFGISLLVASFQKADLKKHFQKKINKLEKEGKLNHHFGKIHLEVGTNSLIMKNSVAESKVSAEAISSVNIRGNCIVIGFGLNELLIPVRNFNSQEDIEALLSKLRSLYHHSHVLSL